MDIGGAIKRLRKKENLSQKELAKRLGRSERAIQKYEYNEALPSIDIIVDMSKLFGVSIDYFVEDRFMDNINKRLEAQGISLEDLAIRISVNKHYLEALDEIIPDEYSYSVARKMAKELQLDEIRLLKLLSNQEPPGWDPYEKSSPQEDFGLDSIDRAIMAEYMKLKL